MAAVLALAVILAWPIDPTRYLAARASPEILDRAGRVLYVFLNDEDQWCLPRDLEAFSPWLVQATLAAEDRRFGRHPGVDPAALVRAAWQNLRRGRVVSGASTLAMQLVKLGGVDSRSLVGKLRQMIHAVRLARRVPDRAILTANLNRAPYGLNLVGAEAAARRYFGKSAAELTLPEAALLAALPRAPTRLMPLARPEQARSRRDWVLDRMRALGMIDEAQWASARAAPVDAGFHPFPGDAPHLAMRLRGDARRTGRLATTLDREIQQLAERTLAEHVAARGDDALGAAIVVDVRTASVLAHVGSANFFDDARAGQFDGAAALRSPGSTLKPFLFAFAFQRGDLYPCEMLLDDTLDFGTYRPRNFDGQYRGLIDAAAALRASLNIPAVLALERVGPAAFADFLREASVATTVSRPDRSPGAGLAVGDCEARLEDLAAAYTMLADLGRFRPLRRLAGEPPVAPRRLLAPGACRAVFEALRAPLPEEADAAAAGVVTARAPTAWKTGTSTGRHDAWAWVFNRHYVVGVWMGDRTRRGPGRWTGVQDALPAAGAIFRRLPPCAEPAWPGDAEGPLREVRVCAASGLPCSPWCPSARLAEVPAEAYLLRVCDVHAPGPGGGVVERWPGAARQWDLADVHGAEVRSFVTAGPAAEADTSDATSLRRALRILDPPPGAEFVLTGEPGGDQLRLRASLDAREPLDWFLDDAYVGRSEPERPLAIRLTIGTHRLVCLGEDGQLAQSSFTVAPLQSTARFTSR